MTLGGCVRVVKSRSGAANISGVATGLMMGTIIGISIWAMSATTAGTEHNNSVKMEQVSNDKPANCDPSDCTPEQAAKCTYGKKAEMSTTANAKSDNICPETKDCPPSKCNPSAKSEKATL